MIIKKFQGNSELEAITKAKDELGKDAIVMNVKTIKPRGIMKLFKSVTVEVTAALEENNAPKPSLMPEQNMQESYTPSFNPNPVQNNTEKTETNEAKEMPSFPPAGYKTQPVAEGKNLEANLEKLQALLQKQISAEEEMAKAKAISNQPKEEADLNPKPRKEKNSNLQFIKMVYTTLLDNEVDERYVNQIMEEMDNVMRSDLQLDSVLSNLYQKLILKFGKPEGVKLTENRAKVVFFIGPTGVGKTTTVAKLASYFKIEKKKRVAFLTADTYRIAATEQLKTYADIINAPLSIVYTPEDMVEELDKLRDFDLVLVDTAGYSHKNKNQQAEIKKLIEAVPEDFETEVYLVLSATTKYKDLKSIVDAYKEVTDYNIIFTKLDETSAYGNLLNIKMYCGADLSYTTNGQNVPDDMEVFNSQRIVKLLLGGQA